MALIKNAFDFALLFVCALLLTTAMHVNCWLFGREQD